MESRHAVLSRSDAFEVQSTGTFETPLFHYGSTWVCKKKRNPMDFGLLSVNGISSRGRKGDTLCKARRRAGGRPSHPRKKGNEGVSLQGRTCGSIHKPHNPNLRAGFRHHHRNQTQASCLATSQEDVLMTKGAMRKSCKAAQKDTPPS